MKFINKKTLRQRGADMTQALLYAAFAIIVLISVLAMYQVVTMSNNKTTATRTLSMLGQEVRTLPRSIVSSGGPLTPILIQAGAVPTDAIDESGTLVKIPYGGIVQVTGDTAAGYSVFVMFMNDGRNAKALCSYLGAGPTGTVLTGPLGSEYRINQDAATTCAGATPYVGAYFP